MKLFEGVQLFMKKTFGKRLLISAVAAAAVLGIGIFLYLQNNTLTIEKYAITLPENTAADQPETPQDAGSVRIVHLSDLHNKGFGKDQKKLLEEISSMNPDMILFTGDLVDSRRDGSENAFILMKALSEKYPVYRILGNHDFSKDGDTVSAALEDTSVITLKNESALVTVNGISINLHGVDDPIRHSRSMREDHYKEDVGKAEPGVYNILLAHRPEYFSLYTQSGYDLVLSGHAHGGQIRLPFVGGLFSPHQGLFPKYYEGMYTSADQNDSHRVSSEDTPIYDTSSSQKDVSMIVSRGLGNSLFPFRVFNYPQIVFIELRK